MVLLWCFSAFTANHFSLFSDQCHTYPLELDWTTFLQQGIGPTTGSRKNVNFLCSHFDECTNEGPTGRLNLRYNFSHCTNDNFMVLFQNYNFSSDFRNFQPQKVRESDARLNFELVSRNIATGKCDSAPVRNDPPGSPRALAACRSMLLYPNSTASSGAWCKIIVNGIEVWI